MTNMEKVGMKILIKKELKTVVSIFVLVWVSISSAMVNAQEDPLGLCPFSLWYEDELNMSLDLHAVDTEFGTYYPTPGDEIYTILSLEAQFIAYRRWVECMEFYYAIYDIPPLSEINDDVAPSNSEILADILSGDFTVEGSIETYTVPGESVTVSSENFDITIPDLDDFWVGISGPGIPGYEDGSNPGDGREFSVRGLESGTYTYTLDIICFEDPLSIPSYVDVWEVCFFDLGPVVTVTVEIDESPTPYVADYTDVIDAGNLVECPSGYIRFSSNETNDSMCAKGEEVTENTDPDGGFVDLVLCDLLGLCESAMEEHPDLLDSHLRQLIAAIGVTIPDGDGILECHDPDFSYPFDAVSAAAVSANIPSRAQLAMDRGQDWLARILYGKDAEELAAECLRALGYLTWSGYISVSVDMSQEIEPDYQLRIPDLAVLNTLTGRWEFIEVKSSILPSGPPPLVKNQILKDRKIEQVGFNGISGPVEIFGPQGGHEVGLWFIRFRSN